MVADYFLARFRVEPAGLGPFYVNGEISRLDQLDDRALALEFDGAAG